MKNYSWPYENELGQSEELTADVLVLGGGLSGCFAAIAAARRGQKVILMEKGAVEKSGSAGTGFDHWESACTNPCSKVTPEEIANAYVNEQDWYSNGIAHYIECREGYDRLLDLESFGGKIRDTEDEFMGAEFRDDETKLMFAYDYENKFTLRVWGSTFKPALAKELKRLGVTVLNRTEATALLVNRDGETLVGAGAMGMNVHTGKFIIARAKATVLCMSRPARVWLFNADTPGLAEFRPFQSIGSGHAMGWRAGMEFTLMEKTVRAEFSAAGRSFPPYGAGNNHNTWYAATMVDARGVEIPYVDRDGKELKTVSERYYPAKGQKFFLKGGVIDNPKYEYRGPETLEFEELMKRGYQLPFFADLSRMNEMERKVIWGMMVGEEAKTKIPIFQNYTERGFDPEKHMLQSYGTGWQSANFLEQERQFFGAPGGLMHDWDLKTNIDGIYAAGDQLYASDCAGFASATGYYAGRKASDHACQTELPSFEMKDVEAERDRLYAPLLVDEEEGMSWKELCSAIAKAMQNYCGGVKCDDLLREGRDLLQEYEKEYVPRLTASNPHDLMRIHEALDILTVAQLVIEASLARKSSSEPLHFMRSDFTAMDPEEDRRHIVIRKEDGQVKTRSERLDFFGDLKEEYEKRNADYMEVKR
ncbi:MAG: FAD-dependent oxidoreductase [Eubacteriales bacterium]|nr:FAD-dependent oxidoreductase [Eubacteriales bacterium]